MLVVYNKDNNMVSKLLLLFRDQRSGGQGKSPPSNSVTPVICMHTLYSKKYITLPNRKSMKMHGVINHCNFVL